MSGGLLNVLPPSPSGTTGWPWTSQTDPAIYLSDKRWPKITIVTPSYNQGRYLEETIRSVLLQNYPDLEYFVIDGGSTDESVDIIRKYESFLTGWVSEKDGGQSDAINKALNRFSGDVFNWINSDDYLTDSALFHTGKAFMKSDTEVFCARAWNFGGRKDRVTPVSTFMDTGQQHVQIPNINQPCTFFSREVVRQLGPLRKDLHYAMDLEWWLKYQGFYDPQSVVLSDEVIVNFREHSDSKTVSQSERATEDKLHLFSAILSSLDDRFRPLGDYRFNGDLKRFSVSYINALVAPVFFDAAVISYGRRQMKRVRELLSYIMPESLSEEKRKRFEKMKFRSTFIPQFFFPRR